VLKKKYLSILGDSISTYKGVSNDASVNSTLIYNPYYYREPMPSEKTYWHIVIDRFGLTLCVNNSWSGGNLSGRDNPDSGVNRAEHLSRDDGTSPDIIIVFMGINDLGRRVDKEVFAKDYLKTLMTVKERHPNARVCCVNIPDRDVAVKERTEIFNSSIEDAVASAGENFFIADLFHSRLNNDCYYMNTLDGLHPDEDGMRTIADIVTEAIEKHCAR
jgi:lysophospholipase L1-like esterase